MGWRLRCVTDSGQRAGMSITRRYFSRRRGLAEFISAGPLAPIIADLAAALEAKGYSACTIHSYVRSARHVTYAIEHHQLGRRYRTLAGLRTFAHVHGRVCRCPHPETRSNANFYCCMPHLLPILRRHGLAAEEKKHPFGDVLAEFDAFMDDVQGLTRETRGTYLRTVRKALSAVMHDGRFMLKRLTLSALQLHVTDVASRHSPYAVHRTVTAIRSLLRFLQTRGVDTATVLTMIKGPRRIPPLASQKSLTVAQTRALLAPLRGIRDPLAMRDLAIMLLLCQVGLRRGDVPRLQLVDFHARTSTLTVSRSKSRALHSTCVLEWRCSECGIDRPTAEARRGERGQRALAPKAVTCGSSECMRARERRQLREKYGRGIQPAKQHAQRVRK